MTSDFYAYYGISRSSEAVRELQTILNGKGASLTVDGIAGSKTLAAVKRYIISKGDKGSLTKWVQQRLNALGYDCGTSDGIAGDKTMSAINKWQSDHNLGQGYLGGSDWNVLLM